MRSHHSNSRTGMTITCTVNIVSEKVLSKKAMKRVMDATIPLQSLGAVIDFIFKRPDPVPPQKNGRRHKSAASKHKPHAIR